MRKHIHKRFLSLSDAKSPQYLVLIQTICENHHEKITKYQALAILKLLQGLAEPVTIQCFDSPKFTKNLKWQVFRFKSSIPFGFLNYLS